MVMHAGLERHALALELRAEPAIEDQHVGEHAGLDAAFGADRLAGLERDEPRQLLDMVVEEPAAFIDEPPALARGELRPAISAPWRRLDRDIDIGARRPRRRSPICSCVAGLTTGKVLPVTAGTIAPSISSLLESVRASARGSSTGSRRLPGMASSLFGLPAALAHRQNARKVHRWRYALKPELAQHRGAVGVEVGRRLARRRIGEGGEFQRIAGELQRAGVLGPRP